MGFSSQQNDVETPVPLADAPPQKYRRLYPNYIRALAACAVVQMHSVGGYLFEFDPANPTDIRFITADIFYGFLRWATPFFILISGALLLKPSKEQPTADFLKRRLRRVLIPFAFWGTIYLLYLYRGNIYFDNLPTWQEVLHKIFYEDVYFHLWFIPMITGLYLMTPVLRIYIQHAKRRDLEYFLVLCFTVNVFQHFLPGVFIIRHIGWMGYIGFYLLGYYLSTYEIPKSWKRVVYPLALAMPLLGAYGTWWLTVRTGYYDQSIYTYASPNVVLMIFAFFLFMKEVDWGAFATRYPRINQGVNRLADLSYGIYFVHVIILDSIKNGYLFGWVITPHKFFNYPMHPALGAPLVALVGVSLSVLAISALGRIPLVKKWLM